MNPKKMRNQTKLVTYRSQKNLKVNFKKMGDWNKDLKEETILKSAP